MTPDPQTPPDAPHEEEAGFGPPLDDGFSWPPSAGAVFLFVVVLFCLGGPLTYWAVLR